MGLFGGKCRPLRQIRPETWKIQQVGLNYRIFSQIGKIKRELVVLVHN